MQLTTRVAIAGAADTAVFLAQRAILNVEADLAGRYVLLGGYSTMLNFNDGTLHVEKARVLMGGWGLLIMLAAVINQFFDLPNPNYVLLLWSGVTILGFSPISRP